MGKFKIAAVDDSEDILYTVTAICKSAGIEVISCRDYREAQTALLRGDINLFLVDFHLPEKDGVEIVKMIRNLDAKVPILMLTVENNPEIAKRVKQAGANDFAMKPIRAVDLISRIEAHLQYQNQSQFYTDYIAGINKGTLSLIRDVLAGYSGSADIKQISEDTGIGAKSVYRYLKYMTEKNMVDVEYSYRDTKGRPRTLYRLRKE